MTDIITQIIDQAMTFEAGDKKVNTSERLQKFTISETTYNQLELIKLRSGLQLKSLVPMLVDAVYAVGGIVIEIPDSGPRKKWYIMMDPDVRLKLDELCSDTGVSAGKMIDGIVGLVTNNLSDNDSGKIDMQSLISNMNWGVVND